jgi:GDPmannose 4,6-dehydratase
MKALITGVTGQDGSYLAESLLGKGYEVFGMVRRSASPNLSRIEHIKDDITLVPGDITDLSCLCRIMESVEPDEVYNLAAQSFVKVSFEEPIHTCNSTGMGFLNVLEAVRLVNPKIKVYQAGSSEMFGKVHESPQSETTPFHPRSPYGVAKAFAHWAAINYRESYDMFVSNGILFNHESPRRGEEFVTKKIVDSVARIHKGQQDKLELGNLDACRDWGFAGDYVEAMYQMLQHDKPDDFVVCTGETHTVREFCETAFNYVGLNYNDYVEVNPAFYRPAEVELLVGDCSKITKDLGWKPKVDFKELVNMMMEDSLK